MIKDLYISGANSPLVRAWKEGRNAGENTTDYDFQNGSIAYVVARFGRNSGVRSQGEESALPQGKTQKERMSFTPKILNGSARLTLLAINGTKNREGALVNELVDSGTQMMERARIQFARQLHNDGTGVLAQVNDATPNTKTTVTVNNVRSINLADIIQKDDSIQIGTTAELTGTGSPMDATVSSVDSGTQIHIAETTSGVADDDYLAFADAYVSGAYTEKMGALGLLVTSGTVQGLDTSTRFYLKSNKLTTGVITKRVLLQYLMLTAAYAKGSNYSMIAGDLYYYLVELFVGTPQPDPQAAAKIFHGGAEGLQIHWPTGTAPITYDPFTQPATIMGLDFNNLGYKTLYALGFVEDGENMIHRVSGYNTYEISMSEAGNAYVVDPKSCFHLSGQTLT
jgi:hypothetical protein